jgi:hypothetical protein
MSITNRLLAPIAIQDRHNNVVSIDLRAFLTRVLFFETYILQSVWLEELAPLARSLGENGLQQLFAAGALKFYCESYAIAQTGQARADLNFTDNSNRLPFGSYSFSVILVKGQEEKIERELSNLSPVLQDEARRHRVSMTDGFSSRVFEGFYGDIRSNPSVLKAAVELELRRQGIKPKRLEVSVEETEPEDFRSHNNLSAEYGLSAKTAHQMVERALLAVGGLNKRFAEMMDYFALSGITEQDAPLLRGKLSVVAKLVDSSNHERRFERVLRAADIRIPVFGEARIDVEKLLRLRESDECRAFRDWLSNTDSLSDAELKDRLTGLNSRIRQAINSKWGHALLFIV